MEDKIKVDEIINDTFEEQLSEEELNKNVESNKIPTKKELLQQKKDQEIQILNMMKSMKTQTEKNIKMLEDALKENPDNNEIKEKLRINKHNNLLYNKASNLNWLKNFLPKTVPDEKELIKEEKIIIDKLAESNIDINSLFEKITKAMIFKIEGVNKNDSLQLRKALVDYFNNHLDDKDNQNILYSRLKYNFKTLFKKNEEFVEYNREFLTSIIDLFN